MTSESLGEVEERVLTLIHDSIRKGKITRDEGFILLQRIIKEVEDEIVLASSNVHQN
jgi:polyhydroxyalkanoate synthesis regulator phasin